MRYFFYIEHSQSITNKKFSIFIKVKVLILGGPQRTLSQLKYVRKNSNYLLRFCLIRPKLVMTIPITSKDSSTLLVSCHCEYAAQPWEPFGQLPTKLYILKKLKSSISTESPPKVRPIFFSNLELFMNLLYQIKTPQCKEFKHNHIGGPSYTLSQLK